MRVTREGEETRVEITSPETIGGVIFRSGDGGRSLEYDGLTLDLTPGEPYAISPCEGAPALLGALTKGSLLYTGRAGEYLTAALTAPGGETVTVWYTPGVGPVYAELSRGGTELMIHIQNWQVQE